MSRVSNLIKLVSSIKRDIKDCSVVGYDSDNLYLYDKVSNSRVNVITSELNVVTLDIIKFELYRRRIDESHKLLDRVVDFFNEHYLYTGVVDHIDNLKNSVPNQLMKKIDNYVVTDNSYLFLEIEGYLYNTNIHRTGMIRPDGSYTESQKEWVDILVSQDWGQDRLQEDITTNKRKNIVRFFCSLLSIITRVELEYNIRKLILDNHTSFKEVKSLHISFPFSRNVYNVFKLTVYEEYALFTSDTHPLTLNRVMLDLRKRHIEEQLNNKSSLYILYKALIDIFME